MKSNVKKLSAIALAALVAGVSAPNAFADNHEEEGTESNGCSGKDGCSGKEQEKTDKNNCNSQHGDHDSHGEEGMQNTDERK